jgi:hypothetical protein
MRIGTHEIIASTGAYAVADNCANAVTDLTNQGIPPEWAGFLAVVAGLAWRIGLDVYDRYEKRKETANAR